MTSDAQRRANAKQDAARRGKRAAVWFEEADLQKLDRLKRIWGLPSRIAVIRSLMARVSRSS